MKRAARLFLAAAVIAAFVAPPAAAGRFFAPNSVWNAPLASTAPLDPSSSALVGELRRQVQAWGPWINTTQNSTPIYTVSVTQPTMRVNLHASAPALAAAFASVPLPTTAEPAPGGDGNLVLWQPSTDTMWEFWHLSRESDGWHAAWGGRLLNASSDPGYFRDRQTPKGLYVERWFWGATATSLPLVGGVITLADLESGHIDHALYMAIPQTRRGVVAWPAHRSDGDLAAPDAIPEGAHFRLDPALNLATMDLPPVTRMIAEAAQRYGIIVGNVAGAVTFRAEDPAQTGTNPYPSLFGNQMSKQLLASFPWARLQLLQMSRYSGS